MRIKVLITGVMLAGAFSAKVHAQQPAPYTQPAPGAQPVYSQPTAQPTVAPGEPAPQAQPGQPGQVEVVEQTSPEAQSVTAEEGRGIEYGAHLVVPVFLTIKGKNIGLGLQGRVGWEFPGGWTTELNAGFMFSAFDDDVEVVDSEGFLADGVSAFWVGGGLRYAFLNPSAFVPFVGAGLAVNLWTPCFDTGTELFCEGDSDLGLSINALGGAAYEISAFAAIEAGLQVNMTFKTKNVWDENEVWVAPFVGGTLYY